MKKLLVLIAIISAFTLSANAQWSGTNPVYTTSDVGIGTSTPGVALKIVRTGADAFSNYPTLHIKSSGTGSTYGPVLYLDGSAGTSGRMWGLVSSGGLDASAAGAAGNFGIYDATANTVRLVINSSGNVGIGTTSPQNVLHVNGGISSTGGGVISSATPSVNLYYDATNDKSVLYSFQPTVAWKPFVFGASTFSFMSTGTNQGLFQDASGNVGVGTTSPDKRLTVNGTVHSTEVQVDLSVPAPDYVFEKSYDLKSLKDIKDYISQNKHLPEIPSAIEMQQSGINLGDMNMKLLKKVEELTLYLIEKDKQVQDQQSQLDLLKQQVKALIAKTATTTKN